MDSDSWHIIDRAPTPSEAMALSETLDQVLVGLEPDEREIVSLSLQGYSVGEVKTRLGCTQAKAYRVLRLIRDRLERMKEKGS
jgi:DNA-directed RNA polymerase specialized sigma24 family protein